MLLNNLLLHFIQAAGLATMISTMRPDIDNLDEYVRNTTARAFAVVASALGIPSLLPFLKAVCKSKKSWQARHTGIKIVQQIAILMGCAILPHLKNLVEIIEHGKFFGRGRWKSWFLFLQKLNLLGEMISYRNERWLKLLFLTNILKTWTLLYWNHFFMHTLYMYL